MREVMNTILHLNGTDCQWDMMPPHLLPNSIASEGMIAARRLPDEHAILVALRYVFC